MNNNRKIYVIAEAGVNHNGSMDLAFRLLDAAADAGADAVKFQTFNSSSLATKAAKKADYQNQTTNAGETQLEMLRGLELTREAHFKLFSECKNRGLDFLSTPFDSESLHFLVRDMGLCTIKLSSGDLTNAPFLLEVSRVAKSIILSTGMASLAEIERGLGVLAFGFTQNNPPSQASFEEAFYSDTGQTALKERVSLLHCTTEYPAPIDEVNLRAMDTLACAFGLATGYSDHTCGIHIPIAASARGAKYIEKHFTLDKSLPGPDHRASLEPHELNAMVAAIRDIERALGDGVKRPTPSEMKNRIPARKSLVIQRKVIKGDPLELNCKRPGSGISPFDFWKWNGTSATRDYLEDELLGE